MVMVNAEFTFPMRRRFVVRRLFADCANVVLIPKHLVVLLKGDTVLVLELGIASSVFVVTRRTVPGTPSHSAVVRLAVTLAIDGLVALVKAARLASPFAPLPRTVTICWVDLKSLTLIHFNSPSSATRNG